MPAKYRYDTNVARTQEGLWLGASATLAAGALALVGANVTFDSVRPHYVFWTTDIMISAYVVGALAIASFAGALRGWPMLLAEDRSPRESDAGSGATAATDEQSGAQTSIGEAPRVPANNSVHATQIKDLAGETGIPVKHRQASTATGDVSSIPSGELLAVVAILMGRIIRRSDTDRLAYPVLATAGFWATGFGLVLIVSYVISGFLALATIGTMVVGCIAIFKGFEAHKKRAQRTPSPLPDLTETGQR
jgi:hypothetical protein